MPLFVRDAVRPDSQRASMRAGLAALFGLLVVSYIFYYVFDAWFYLRYLLPAMPALFVLMAAGIRAVCRKLPLPAQAPAAILLVACGMLLPLRFAQGQSIFNQYDFEQRYVIAAHYVAQLTTPKAIILAVQHSGSVRYYANRITLRYDFLAPDGLDAVLQELIEKGYHPYIVIDDSEEPDFRRALCRHEPRGTPRLASAGAHPQQPASAHLRSRRPQRSSPSSPLRNEAHAHRFLIYCLVTIAITFPLITALATALPNDPGDPALNTWILWWNAHAVPYTARWWNAPAFYPGAGALAFSENLLGLSLISTPLQWLGAGPQLAYNVVLLLTFPLCAHRRVPAGARADGT